MTKSLAELKAIAKAADKSFRTACTANLVAKVKVKNAKAVYNASHASEDAAFHTTYEANRAVEEYIKSMEVKQHD